jgi:hypothetical protein
MSGAKSFLTLAPDVLQLVNTKIHDIRWPEAKRGGRTLASVSQSSGFESIHSAGTSRNKNYLNISAKKKPSLFFKIPTLF